MSPLAKQGPPHFTKEDAKIYNQWTEPFSRLRLEIPLRP
jgi:hypothetical protein